MSERSFDPTSCRSTLRPNWRYPIFGLLILAATALVEERAAALDFDPAELIYREDFEGESGFPTTPEIDVSASGSFVPSLGPDGTADIAAGALRIGQSHRDSLEAHVTEVRAVVGANNGDDFGLRLAFRNQDPIGFFRLASVFFVALEVGSEEISLVIPLSSFQPQTMGLAYNSEALFASDGWGASSVIPTDITNEMIAGDSYTIDLLVDRTTRSIQAGLSINGRAHTSSAVDLPDLGTDPIDAVTIGVLAIGLDWPNSVSAVELEEIEFYAATNTAARPLVAATQKIGALEGVTGPLDPLDRFGVSIANIGDQDGDGVDDLAVGADFDDDANTNTGAVYILFMNTDGTVASEQKISALAGNFPGPLAENDRFGQPIEVLSDLDDDGRREIAVGARRTAGNGVARGAIWILDLDADGTVESASRIAENEGGFLGSLPDGANLSTMANLGDVNGDGFDDLAVGAWGSGSTLEGSVWILFLDGDGLVQGQQPVTPAFDLSAGDRFGASLAGIGDLDGDGVPDLAVGADSTDYTTDGVNFSVDVGEIHVFLLNSDGTTKSSSIIGLQPYPTGQPVLLAEGDTFGLDIAALGDFNRDGIPDLAAGSAGNEDEALTPDTGAVQLLFLNEDGTLKAQQKISNRAGGFDAELAAQDFFGFGLRALGDHDGDGRFELAVGATGDDDGGSRTGAIYIVDLERTVDCDWVRYHDQAAMTSLYSEALEIFDFSTVALDSNGDAGFSNGHDFGRFTWESLSISADIDLFGTPDPDGTLWVTDRFAPPIQGSPGAGGPSGSDRDNDDFVLTFAEPMAAAGLEILGNRADHPFESIDFRDAADNTIASFRVPGSNPGAAGGDGGGFIGLSVCEGYPGISSIVVREGNASNSDNDDIGFTNVVTVPVPEPSRTAALLAGVLMIFARRARKPLHRRQESGLHD